MRETIFIVLAVAGLAACTDEADRPIPPETLNERRGAFRQACAAGELAARAADDVATIEQVLANIDPADPLAGINRMASSAALEYARAYQAHAELRATAYAYLDSAVNYSATTADSARYLERAGGISLRLPEAGTVEENVLVSYQSDFTAILQDGNHPCNWDIPF